MTIADEIRMEERENIIFNHIKGLWEDGKKAEYIASVLKLPFKEVEEIIKKIENTSK
ncbi:MULTISPECIES: hypothetical protein [unclassified Arcicella]|uniref:hypothetical protein n=1 Tax=unclassified Arcicella TaxID=2644986 RepID=UPI0028645717|nr:MULTISPECIES: hypothetical protein [unclassified Arcicella]MDR6560096.1 NADH:ubiquinone oxidoreductase subunit E [Arcicella sp. BE51]MDR6810297.1 NADH:ubiquinone oxidoreductase subunit E [Arcicella sp. BE140]MDR6821647.1 NADH:ubiquinone oxidoreductase subunit E [Arcicella sp. BE139]